MSFISVFMVTKASKVVITSIASYNESQKFLAIMSNATNKRTLLLNQILHTSDPFIRDEYFMEINSLATHFSLARAKFKSFDLDRRSQGLLDRQGELAKTSVKELVSIYELAQSDDLGEAIDLYLYSLLPRQKDIISVLSELSLYQFDLAENELATIKKNRTRVIQTIVGVSGLTFLLTLLLALSVTKKSKKNRLKLERQARTDSLTDLPNRKQFIKIVESQMTENVDTVFAIIFLDIDYFKSINDNYGHDVGDEVLKKFTSIIQANIRPMDTLARFGGDEFVLLLSHINCREDAHNFLKKLSGVLETSITINDNEIFISASIGGNLYPWDASNAKQLLKNADIAMYSAKQAGRNCFKCFSKTVSDAMAKEHSITHALHTIIKNKNKKGELFLKYQPLHNIKNGDIREYEALIRWRNTEGVDITPDEFIPLAEKSNLIEKINLFVIDEVCKQQSKWQAMYIKPMRVNINLSGNRIIFEKLLERFYKNINDLNLSPSSFGIELTERTLNQISNETIQALDVARKQGMKISIDDFGTDYSSLIYLKKLPVTTLKIDKVFIDDLSKNSEDEALVKTIIDLGHSLHLDVVAEGVETIEQVNVLKKHACNIAQGYYFNKPLSSEQVTRLQLVA